MFNALKNMNPNQPHSIMTTFHLITILITATLFGWSLLTVRRLLAPEEEQSIKEMKVHRSRKTRRVHSAVICSGIVSLAFLPAVWPIVAGAAVYGWIVTIRLARKEMSLSQEILTHQDQEAILVIHLGHAYDNPKGPALKLRFMPCESSWPLAKLETGINHITLPIQEIGDQHLREHFLPRVAAALTNEDLMPLFLSIKSDLLAHGVTHAIDIEGWNYHPIIRDFIERILSADSSGNLHPQQVDYKAA